MLFFHFIKLRYQYWFLATCHRKISKERICSRMCSNVLLIGCQFKLKQRNQFWISPKWLPSRIFLCQNICVRLDCLSVNQSTNLVKITYKTILKSQGDSGICVWSWKEVLLNGPYLPNPFARAGYDTRSIFKRSLTGLNSEFSFS